MTTETSIGLAADIGGTSTRMALVDADNNICALYDAEAAFDHRATSAEAGAVYDALAGDILAAQEQGARWLVAGFPCPVNPTDGGQLVGGAGNPANPFYGPLRLLQDELHVRGIDPSFPVYAVNDLVQFTFAAAQRFAQPQHNKVLGIGIGTGLGTDLVIRNADGSWGNRPEFPMELGALGPGPWGKGDNYTEGLLSGPVINAELEGKNDQERQAILHEKGRILGEFIVQHAFLFAPELVVVGGGAGSAFQDFLKPGIKDMFDELPAANIDLGYLKNWQPEIVFVPELEADHFALYGARAVAACIQSNPQPYTPVPRRFKTTVPGSQPARSSHAEIDTVLSASEAKRRFLARKRAK